LTFSGKRRQKAPSFPVIVVDLAVDPPEKGVRSTMSEKRLTKQRIESLQPRDVRYFESDGLRLYLVVHPSGTKTWTSRVRWQGRDLDLSLGEWPEVGLEEARRRHEENRRLSREGRDPRRPTECGSGISGLTG
jgi:hypothetical protein